MISRCVEGIFQKYFGGLEIWVNVLHMSVVRFSFRLDRHDA